MLVVDLGQRANTIGGEELVLIQEVLEHTLQTLSIGNGQQMAELPAVQRVQIRDLEGAYSAWVTYDKTLFQSIV